MSTPEAYRYSGTANLEVMAEAVHYNAFLSKLLADVADQRRRVVDFGAGIGTFAIPLADGNRDIAAVEPDPILQAAFLNSGVSCFASINSIPDGWADLVYSFNVLEHIEDDVETIAIIHNKIRNGGILLIYVPAFPLLYSAMDRQVGHVRRYTRIELTMKIQQSGFEIIQSEYVDSLGFVASLGYKLLPGVSGNLSARTVAIYDRFVFPLSRSLDRLTSRMFGKNLLVIARRP